MLQLDNTACTVLDTAAVSDSSAAGGTLSSTEPCSGADGSTCQDVSVPAEINVTGGSDSEITVVLTSTQHVSTPTVSSTYTQSAVSTSSIPVIVLYIYYRAVE